MGSADDAMSTPALVVNSIQVGASAHGCALDDEFVQQLLGLDLLLLRGYLGLSLTSQRDWQYHVEDALSGQHQSLQDILGQFLWTHSHLDDGLGHGDPDDGLSEEIELAVTTSDHWHYNGEFR